MTRFKPSRIAKAIAGAAAAAVAAGLSNAMADGNLTGPELVAALGLGLGAGAVVYRAPKNVDA